MGNDLAVSIDQLVGTDASMLSDAALRGDIIEVRKQLDRLEYHYASMLAVADRRALAWADGHGSTPAWVQAHTGQSKRDAKRALDAGLAMDSLPLVDKAWAQGEISTSAATEIAAGRRVDFGDEYAAIESLLVGFAAGWQWRELRASIARYRQHCDALEDKEPSDRNGLFFDKVNDRWAANGDFDDHDGSLIKRALDSAMAGDLPFDDRTPAKKRADAWVEISRYYLDHGDLPFEDGRAPHLTIGFDLQFATDGLPCKISIWDGPHASLAQMARLACEATIAAMAADPDGNPLYMGREIRDANRPQRRALARRDGGCRFPGCDRLAWRCHPHHAKEWERDHGPTDLDNLVLLCAFHHHVVHRKGWGTTYDGITFTVTRDGRIIGQTPNPGIPPPAG